MQGYDADHPNIELLRLRSFTMGRRLSDQDVLAPNVLERVMDLIAGMTPFVRRSRFFTFPSSKAWSPSGTVLRASLAWSARFHISGG